VAGAYYDIGEIVGNYPDTDSAFRVYRQLQAAGFEAVQEQVGNIYKVFAVGIPAPSVYYATRRLGAIIVEQLVANGYLGKGSTFEKLSTFWSANKEYEANLIRILRDMYQYQHDSRG
jgi:hypothetical protein